MAMLAAERFTTTLLFLITVGLVFGMAIIAIGRTGEPGEQPAHTRRWMAGAALGLALWLAFSGALAISGILRDFQRTPPPMLVLATLSGLLTLLLAGSPIGARLASGLSIGWLVGFQAFRILVELCLALLYHHGAVPRQMTIEGRNFDLLSGLTALMIAWLATSKRLPTWGLLIWNLFGLGLLLNIVVISVISMPLPMRMFFNEPANLIVTAWPFVWLPVFLVQMALLGHLLVFRRLWRDRQIKAQNTAAWVAKAADH